MRRSPHALITSLALNSTTNASVEWQQRRGHADWGMRAHALLAACSTQSRALLRGGVVAEISTARQKFKKSTFPCLQQLVLLYAHPNTHLRGFVVASSDEAVALSTKESHARHVARVSVDRARQELGRLDVKPRLMVARVRHRGCLTVVPATQRSTVV